MNLCEIDVNYLRSKYPNFMKIMCDYSLLKAIVCKQKEFAELSEVNYKRIDSLYMDYCNPDPKGNAAYMNFVRYLNLAVNKMAFIFKYVDTDLVKALFSRPMSDGKRKFLKRGIECFVNVDCALSRSFLKHYDFVTGKVKHSSFDLDYFCKDIIIQGITSCGYNESAFRNSYVYKSFKTGEYNMISVVDSTVLNGDFYTDIVYNDVTKLFELDYREVQH